MPESYHPEPPLGPRFCDIAAAADAWLDAIHAVTTADEEQDRTEVEEEALATAEIELAAAIMAWRHGGRPD
jgi:hypothetical protein